MALQLPMLRATLCVASTLLRVVAPVDWFHPDLLDVERSPCLRYTVLHSLTLCRWEARKGWDVLIGAYLQAFTSEDDVEL